MSLVSCLHGILRVHLRQICTPKVNDPRVLFLAGKLMHPSPQHQKSLWTTGRPAESSLFGPNHRGTEISLASSANPLVFQKRFKKKGKKGKSKNESESESEDEKEDKDEDDFDMDDDDGTPKDYKIVDVSTPSLRLDSVIKNALPLTRKQIEDAFYDGRLRVNDQPPKKKAEEVEENDIIDYIRGLCPENPDLLEVWRLEVIQLPDHFDSGRFKIKMKRWKDLRIQNYPEGVKYEGVMIAREQEVMPWTKQ